MASLMGSVLFCVVVLVLSLNPVAAASRHGPRKSHEHGGLHRNFYQHSCPHVERIVFREIAQAYKVDKTLPAGLLRILFHDCFVRGCDCSLLLRGDDTERMARANSNLHGFEALEAAKRAVEKACPGVVSCSDVLQFATRDAVILSGGQGWELAAGRRDGTVSSMEDVNLSNLPSPFADVSTLIALFQKKGLNAVQMVALSGAHTLGKASCAVIDNRVHGPKLDPHYPAHFAKELKRQCPKSKLFEMRVALDSTPLSFDTQYFRDVLLNKGLMTSDRALLDDPRTRLAVHAFAQGPGLAFRRSFGEAMVALSKVGVLTGSQGEIRAHMQVVNSH